MADLLLSPVLDAIIQNLATLSMGWFGKRWNVKDHIEKLQHTLPMVQAILEDAEEQQASNTAVRIWLSKFKEVAFSAEDLLLSFQREHKFRTCLVRAKLADEISEMLQALQMASEEGLSLNLRERVAVHDKEWDRRETSSFVVEAQVYGRDDEKDEIIRLLLSGETTGGGGEASCISIVGIGGMGKTTLAQLAYNDEKVTQHFDVKVWVFVSDQFNVKKIMTTVIESLTKAECRFSSMEALHSEVSSLLCRKRYLIVLDDIWTEDQDDWHKLGPLFRGGIDGSKILITTRSRRVVLVTDSPTIPYYLKELSEDACWELFKRRAFQRGEEEQHQELLPIGQQIVKKCGGVALAARTLGSLMRFKRDKIEWMFVRDSNLWNLEECKSGILPALRLSYSRLPRHLKRCFSFCALFPRHYEFKKEKLIHLWMAGGFIERSTKNRGKEPEDVGNDYFNDLQWLSFFQEIKQHENGGVVRYKMHDVIYDLVQSVTNSEYTILDRGYATPTSFTQLRHSSIVSDFRSSMVLPEELYQANHLRTLLLFSGGNFEVVPQRLYSSCKYLFVLDLDGSGLKILDGSIQSLLLLKYLDLSHTVIRRLPSEIETLSQLETLNLSNCCHLEELPDLTRMHSLRHLNNDGCKALTRMIKSSAKVRPSQIQTVPLFVVGGVVDLNFLESLNVRGSLKITHLENATLGFSGLKVKEGLEYLGLYWGSDDGCPNINPEEEDVVSKFDERTRTQSSRPSLEIQIGPQHGEEVLMKVEIFNCNLKRLLVKGYPGYRFHGWNIPLSLKVIDLISCRRSTHFPSLGNLQFLTSLSLREMHGVRRIDGEFYCEGNEKPFPVLKELVLVDFPNLVEWLSPHVGRDAFPNLSKLTLRKCPKLNMLPQISSIQHLDLVECNATLVQYYLRNLTSLETLVVEKISNLFYFLDAFLSNYSLLRSLEIKSFPSLRSLPRELGNLAALKSLTIRWCEELSSLPQSLQNLSALESLEISDCHSLSSLPDGGNGGLSNLRSLSIENCNNLTSLSMGFEHMTSLELLTIMYCPLVSALPWTVKHLSALRSLSILCCSQLMYLTEGLQNLSGLQSLEIRSCPNLEVFPDWIEKLVSLRSLSISGCHNLRRLPEGLKCLTSLQHLSIQDCPDLVARCREDRSEDWPKIAHVPYKLIESPSLKRPREEGSSSSSKTTMEFGSKLLNGLVIVSYGCEISLSQLGCKFMELQDK